MHGLFIPGNNPGNREVTFELAQSVRGFESATLLEYPHWYGENPDQSIADIEAASDMAIKSTSTGEEFAVIAKSIGVNVCLRAESKGFEPVRAVFVGAAINEGVRAANPVDHWLRGRKTPTTWIQQKADPYLSSDDLREYLQSTGLEDIDFVELNGSSHSYRTEEVAEVIRDRLELS